MHTARIAELLEPFLGTEDNQQLTTQNLDRISMYIDILLRWNTSINLTAIHNEEEIVTRHFGESLFAARHLFPLECGQEREVHGHSPGNSSQEQSGVPAGSTLADIGSGAGFPGIPVKLWAPQLHVTLIESNHKKATFLREVTRMLALTDIDIKNARAESVRERHFDTVTLRAVDRFESILPAAARLLASTGRLALLIGSAQLAQAELALPSLSWSEPKSIPLSRSRILVMTNETKNPTV